MRGCTALAVALLALLTGCDRVRDEVEARFLAGTPREAYEHALRVAGLGETALVRDWRGAGRRSLEEAPPIEMPFVETGFMTPVEPAAMGYRVRGVLGQKVTVAVELEADTSALVFIDVFRAYDDPGRAPDHVMSADSGATRLEFRPWRNVDYLIRIQPELFRGGRYTVRVRAKASLAFPVDGAGLGNIQSFFGDARDGGRRDHHGVDIFVPRGTPALAAAAARVTRVQSTPRGGRVVWLRDDEGNALYYAHLDSQTVSVGTRVEPGDTVGLIGNTGNARTTPPHLHFGVYRRGMGPLNPYPFVYEPRGEPAEITVDTTILGRWTRASRAGLSLRRSPESRSVLLDALSLHTPLRVTAVVGRWYRVHLPDGRTGFVAGELTEDAGQPIRTARVSSSVLRSGPTPDAPVVEAMEGEAELDVLGRFGRYYLVQSPAGRTGWIQLD